MFNCFNKPMPDEVAVKSQKSKAVPQKPIGGPIMLSTNRYEKILHNATHTELSLAIKQSEEDQKYREYLKKGSDELVARFEGKLKMSQDEVLDELREAEKKLIQARKTLRMSKENDEIVRREKIMKAQQLIEKLKPGPRELHSAALHSEVLRARNVQRNINEEFEKAIKQNEIDEKNKCDQQSMPWIQEEQQRIAEHQKRNNSYKQEILQTINDNSKQRTEYKKQLIKEQIAAREAVDQEIKAQIEKEKAIMEKKRAALRKNALEAMKMVEQRRMRERMTEECEDRLCCAYQTGKRHLDHLKNDQVKQMAAERVLKVERNAQLVAGTQQNIYQQEAERLKRDVNCMQLKFTAEEQEKKRKDKAAKQARIEAYMRELEQQKEAKRRAEEEKRFEIARRYKNEEINCLFVEAEKQDRLRKIQEVRTTLNTQAEQDKKAKASEKDVQQEDLQQLKKYDRDDRFFFEYAKNLMEDAQKKDRPLYPFIKVVNHYKRENNIDCERTEPRHLVSVLKMGLRQPGDSKADADHAAKACQSTSNTCQPKVACQNDKPIDKQKQEKVAAKGADTANDDKEKILENCLKITEIIAAGGSKADDKNKSLNCDNTCPVECAKHGVAKPSSPAKKHCGLDVDAAGVPECVSSAPSMRVRYSMCELRKLNQFAAPTCH